MKLTTLFISRAKQICAKPLTASQSEFKIKARQLGQFSEFSYVSSYLQKKNFCTKTRLSNIFKTLIKTILESLYKVL